MRGEWESKERFNYPKVKVSPRHYRFFLKYLNNMNVLEVGAGYGFLSSAIKKKNKLDIVELNPYRADYLKDEGFNVRNCSFFDIEDKEYDAVVMSQVLMHLPIEQSLDKVKRCLKDGGLFVFSVINKNSILRKEYAKEKVMKEQRITKLFTKQTLRETLKGFKIIRMTYRPTYIFNLHFGEASLFFNIVDKLLCFFLGDKSDYIEVCCRKERYV